jgi:hypothetical protein
MNRADALTFRCGCPKAGNIALAGGRERCERCYRAYQKSYRRHTYLPSGTPESSTTPLVVADTTADAIALYRHEKARRAERPDPRMLAAKVALEALRERDRENQRGGRPKKSFGSVPGLTARKAQPGKPQIFAMRPDPKDALLDAVAYYGPER